MQIRSLDQIFQDFGERMNSINGAGKLEGNKILQRCKMRKILCGPLRKTLKRLQHGLKKHRVAVQLFSSPNSSPQLFQVSSCFGYSESHRGCYGETLRSRISFPVGLLRSDRPHYSPQCGNRTDRLHPSRTDLRFHARKEAKNKECCSQQHHHTNARLKQPQKIFFHISPEFFMGIVARWKMELIRGKRPVLAGRGKT